MFFRAPLVITRYRPSLVILLLVTLPTPARAGDAGPFPTPAEIASSLRLDPGLRAELVAGEPEIESPVAMAFDEEGRLWVVEMRDYPHGPPPGQRPESRIKILDDRDGDGRYETSVIFEDALSFPNGVLPWQGGAIITAAPYIKWLKDTDGDGRSDRGEILYEGFSTDNPQLRVSHPNLGLDGWIYVANGLRGGRVQRHRRPEGPVIELGGMDFRFDPIKDRGEAISGMGQFGLTFDDWGRRFVCDNRHHVRHIVLPHNAIRRNPYLAAPAVIQDVSEGELGEGDSGAKTYPLSKNWTTSSLALGRFTAACSVFVYRGDLLPASYRGAVFTCDPTGNLVHEETFQDDGASFRTRPARAGVEFLASPDDRFRPVFLGHGPDGALYVVDMARAVIEHPQFMPIELKNRPDLLVGKDKGRIWRIVPDPAGTATGTKARRPHLAAASAEELVALLGHPNAWWRTTAHRLLLTRNDPGTPALLHACAEGASEPLARLHAAWLLDASGALDDALIVALSRDESPGLRENAAMLAESRIMTSAVLQRRLAELADDPVAKVRFQVALSLGGWNDDRIIDPLRRIALAGAGDSWTRLAVASAVPERAGALIAALLQPRAGPVLQATPERLALVRELSAQVGARRDGSEVAATLETLLANEGPEPARWQLAGLDGLVEGMARRGTKLAVILEHLPRSGVSQERTAALRSRLDAWLRQAAEVASDTRRETGDRVDAVRILAQAPWSTVESLLARLLTADPAPEVRLAAVQAAALHDEPAVAPWLLQYLRQVTPAVQREILASLIRQPERVTVLLDEVERRRLAPGDLDAIAITQLIRTGRPDLRERARTLLTEGLPQDRRQVLARYQPAVDQEGEAARGRLVFQKNCATCHNVAGVGVRVGPDIADTRIKTRGQLLFDILNPNGAIDGNYLNYTVSTRDGQVHGGMIAAESASSLTLKRAEGQTEVILRQDIDEVRSTGASLMPEGLEKSISIDEMRDLITFLKNWRYDDGRPPAALP
jgi:putative membrane-bound dehydrogenase-like protein